MGAVRRVRLCSFAHALALKSACHACLAIVESMYALTPLTGCDRSLRECAEAVFGALRRARPACIQREDGCSGRANAHQRERDTLIGGATGDGGRNVTGADRVVTPLRGDRVRGDDEIGPALAADLGAVLSSVVRAGASSC
jgi:hypothetical protein